MTTLSNTHNVSKPRCLNSSQSATLPTRAQQHYYIKCTCYVLCPTSLRTKIWTLLWLISSHLGPGRNQGGVIRTAQNNTYQKHKTIWFRYIVKQTRDLQSWDTEIMLEAYLIGCQVQAIFINSNTGKFLEENWRKPMWTRVQDEYLSCEGQLYLLCHLTALISIGVIKNYYFNCYVNIFCSTDKLSLHYRCPSPS